MPSPADITNITPPRVPLIDERTGLISREWYRFFLSLFRLTGSGANFTSLTDLQVGPPTVTVDEFNALLPDITDNNAAVSGLQSQIAELITDVQALAEQPRAELGTLSQLQQDNVPWLQFDTTPAGFPTGPDANGTMYWDDADAIKTMNLVMEDSGEVIQHIGEETFYRVKATAAITKGQVVMITGTVGASGGLLGAPATGLTAAQGENILGVATQNIALNSWGYVTWFGEVKQINTTGGSEAWVDGQILYYNPAVTGGLTKNVPTAPNPKVIVAAVINAATNGILFIRPTFGSVLGVTDSNVEISGLANGDTLVYDSADQRWENRAQSTLVVSRANNLSGGAAGSVPYQTAANVTAMLAIGAANRVLTSSGTAPQWSTGLALTSASSVEVTDNVNAALRITQLGTGDALLVEDSANPDATPFVIDANGRVINGYTASLSIGIGGDLGTQLLGSAGASGQTMARFDNTVTGARFQFLKSRSSTTGSSTIVQNGDSLGTIAWYGDDGAANYASNGGVLAAFIGANVDGTPGANDMPGRITFSTTADGASSPTERLRISSTGKITASAGTHWVGSTSSTHSWPATFSAAPILSCSPNSGLLGTTLTAFNARTSTTTGYTQTILRSNTTTTGLYVIAIGRWY
jgi:hypothetical protein